MQTERTTLIFISFLADDARKLYRQRKLTPSGDQIQRYKGIDFNFNFKPCEICSPRNLLTNHEGHGQKDPGRRGRRRP